MPPVTCGLAAAASMLLLFRCRCFPAITAIPQSAIPRHFLIYSSLNPGILGAVIPFALSTSSDVSSELNLPGGFEEK